jgi:hypothetical protein
MSNPLILNVAQPASGLQTMTYTVPAGVATQTYSVLSQLTEIPPSSISVVINKNASPIFTAPSLSPTQGAQQFKYSFEAAANDALQVVYSSSSFVDQQLNNVKSITALYQGL